MICLGEIVLAKELELEGCDECEVSNELKARPVILGCEKMQAFHQCSSLKTNLEY